ncbi:MAG: Hsp20/alpha crystallin family protein [Flavobacteriales bacterium]|nr:Hsp20/alpha crystallin family protein [Flavobacteriales bacterium]
MTHLKYRTQPPVTHTFGDLLNTFFGGDISQAIGSDDPSHRQTHVNIVERESDFQLELLAPGFSKEDLVVNMDQNMLTISAEKKMDALKENERYTRREFSMSGFKRSFRLPEGIDVEKISAQHADGVLRLSIPKAVQAKPLVKRISIA